MDAIRDAPKLVNVTRLDSIPLGKATYTEEGYLEDTPILTTTGIFEYKNPDGSTRKELRLPEEVFAPESLRTYMGRPVILTHGAGLITKDNVHQESIGTILSEGFRDGDSVRARIIIHDTDAMKKSNLKELSLGYNLDLDETPGVWNGQPYDAIQRNIRINHLALVFEARAGDQARLNIDGRDPTDKEGESKMDENKNTTPSTRTDGVLSPEELKKAIEEYRAKRSAQSAAADKKDSADTPASEPDKKDESPEAVVGKIKEAQAARSAEGAPKTTEEAEKVIAKQDGEMELLFNIIDTLLAERDFDSATKAAADKADKADKADSSTEPAAEPDKKDCDDPTKADKSDKADKADSAAEAIPSTDKAEAAKMNADSVDAIVRQRVQLGMIGQALNLDGLEAMNMADAKIAVIQAVIPGMRLDGKGDAYIEAMFDCACKAVKENARKDTAYQRGQMFHRDSAKPEGDTTSSAARRQAMIDRQHNRNKEDK